MDHCGHQSEQIASDGRSSCSRQHWGDEMMRCRFVSGEAIIDWYQVVVSAAEPRTGDQKVAQLAAAVAVEEDSTGWRSHACARGEPGGLFRCGTASKFIEYQQSVAVAGMVSIVGTLSNYPSN
uniref:Uncharacterized protein n=1 Tax=Romanomermis culicivorax TaxID=13658 RepID=A0A915KJF2_ROMCU